MSTLVSLLVLVTVINAAPSCPFGVCSFSTPFFTHLYSLPRFHLWPLFLYAPLSLSLPSSLTLPLLANENTCRRTMLCNPMASQCFQWMAMEESSCSLSSFYLIVCFDCEWEREMLRGREQEVRERRREGWITSSADVWGVLNGTSLYTQTIFNCSNGAGYGWTWNRTLTSYDRHWRMFPLFIFYLFSYFYIYFSPLSSIFFLLFQRANGLSTLVPNYPETAYGLSPYNSLNPSTSRIQIYMPLSFSSSSLHSGSLLSLRCPLFFDFL